MSKTVVGILEEARSKIERGWCQDGSARTETGKAVPIEHPDAVQWCLTGAVDSVCRKETLAKGVAFRLLRGVTYEDYLAAWNDENERTKEDVLKAFDDAIALERRRIWPTPTEGKILKEARKFAERQGWGGTKDDFPDIVRVRVMEAVLEVAPEDSEPRRQAMFRLGQILKGRWSPIIPNESENKVLNAFDKAIHIHDVWGAFDEDIYFEYDNETVQTDA